MKKILAIAAVALVLGACTLGEDVVSASPASARDSIDLSAWTTDSVSGEAFSDAPGMSAIVPFGGKAFVVLQRLDADWTSKHKSVVVVLDPASRKQEAAIVLPASNPTFYTVVDGILYLACTGDYGVLDGGVVAVDMAARTAKMVASESALGGDVSAIQVSGAKGFATVMSWPNGWVRPFELASGKVDSTISGIDSASGSVVADGSLWIGLARPSKPSIVRYDIASGTLHDTVAVHLEPREMQLGSDGRIVVLQARYGSAGGLGAVDLVDRSTRKVANFRMMSHSNWSMSVRDGGVYLFDRMNSVVTSYAGVDSKNVSMDENVGPGTNPYDAAKFGSETWVARFGSNSVLILK